MTQKKDSNNNLEQFLQVVAQESELQEKLKSSVDEETYISSIVEIGAERGYNFTREQVEATLGIATAKQAEEDAQSTKLSEQELELVAGGKNYFKTYAAIFRDIELRDKIENKGRGLSGGVLYTAAGANAEQCNPLTFPAFCEQGPTFDNGPNC